jgi:hypothetical protein
MMAGHVTCMKEEKIKINLEYLLGETIGTPMHFLNEKFLRILKNVKIYHSVHHGQAMAFFFQFASPHTVSLRPI